MSDGKTQTPAMPNARTASSLGLAVPEQSPAPTDSFLLDPRETSDWLKGLPMANIGETARQIYRALLDFNRYQLPEMVRAKIVELFRPPVDYICQNLRRHYMDMGFPLSEKALKTATLSRELNNELAIAYKTIIERMLGGQTQRFDRKLLVITMHRAMHYLGRIALQNQLTYASPPPGLWREINSLYAFALQNRVHQVPIKMKLDEEELISTIEDNYKGILLLAAAVPCRLRQNHMLQLYQEIRHWVPLTKAALTDEQTMAGNGQFNIDLAKDEGPVHSGLRAPQPGPHTLTLDVRPLLKKLREDFEKSSWDSGQEVQASMRSIARPLLRQLIMHWNRPPERRFVRTRLNFELQVIAGLQSIHDNLSREQQETPAAQPLALAPGNHLPGGATGSGLASVSTEPASAMGTLDGANLSLAPLSGGSFGGDSMSSDSFLNVDPSSLQHDLLDDWNEEHAARTVNAKPTVTVKTHNESAGGYCIDWSSANRVPKVKVGELVGIAASGHRHRYSLGVVRWLNLNQAHKLNLGLEILSSGVEAAKIRPATAEGTRRAGSNPVNCLLLPVSDSDPGSEISRIVMNNVSFPVGSRLWLNSDGQERLIRLTKLMEFNSAFALFQFTHDARDDKEQLPGKSDDKNFDDLWSNL